MLSKTRQQLIHFLLVFTIVMSVIPINSLLAIAQAQEKSLAIQIAPPMLKSSFAQQTMPDALTMSTALQHSLALDGTGDYVEVPHNQALTPISALTVEAWVHRVGGSRCESIIGKDFRSAFWLGFCNEKITFYTGGLPQDGITTIPTNLWTHIAVVWDSTGNSRRYYINGELDYTGNAGPSPVEQNVPLAIGADSDGTSTFAGNLAEVRLWSVARTIDDIRRTMHIRLDERRPGLVASWHLTDDYVDTIGGFSGVPHGDASFTGESAPPQPVLVPVDANFNTLPAPLTAAATAYVAHLNRAFLLGGMHADGVTDEILAVDPASGASTHFSTLPRSLAHAAAVYIPTHNTIYLFGGDNGGALLDTVESIDLTTSAVRTLTVRLPAAMMDLVAVYHAESGKIYLLGGNSANINSANVSVFDIATETITAAGFSLPESRSRMAAIYASVTGKIYGFGGRIESSSTDTDSIFEITLHPDGLNGTVTVLPVTLPQANAGLRAVEDPHSDLVYLIGGAADDARSIVVFDPITGQLWQTPIQLPAKRQNASLVYDARNRQAVLIGGEDELLTPHATIWRMALGDGPALPIGRWDFPPFLNNPANAISGSGRKVVVATAGSGIRVYNEDGNTFDYTSSVLGSANGIVNDVRYNDANGDIWVATNDSGGKLIANGVIQNYDSSMLGTNRVLAVDFLPSYTDVERAPFFGTFNQGLRWRPFNNLGVPDWYTNFPGLQVQAIQHRVNSEAWAIVGNRLGQLSYTGSGVPSGTTITSDLYAPSRSCDLSQPHDLAFDQHGDLWIVSATIPPVLLAQTNAPSHSAGTLALAATPGQGVCLVRNPTDTNATSILYTTAIGSAASSVDVDVDGRVWVAIQAGQPESIGLGGLAVYQNLVDTLRTDEFDWRKGPLGSKIFLSNPRGWDSGFRSVGAADERVWAGKNNGKLVTLAQRWQQLDESNDLAQKAVTGLWTVRGRLFAATTTGLHVLAPDGKTWDNRVMTDAQPQVVLGDQQGRIWVGTSRGVRLYTPTGWDLLASTVGVPPDGFVRALAEDHHGRIWIGAGNGLTLYDRGRWVATFTQANSQLPSASINSLLVDSRNRLWVGTSGDGLAMLENEVFTVYNTGNGLPSNYIFDLAQPGDGRIAISTDSGLAYFDDASGFTTESAPNFATYTPLTVDEQGRLWAGSTVHTTGGWQSYYPTNSGLRSNVIFDNAADGADRIWFSHSPNSGISLRGTLLPPLSTVVPTIASASPDNGSAGTRITISGTGFSTNLADLDVTIGGAPAEIVSASETQIVAVVAANATSGTISVSTSGRRVTYGGPARRQAFCAVPVIHSFTPTGGNIGVQVKIHGTNFSSARVALTDGSSSQLPDAMNSTAQELWVQVESAGNSGPVRVENHAIDCPVYSATSTASFQAIALTLSELRLNQGIEAYGLMANRQTLIQQFLTRNVELRHGVSLELDTLRFVFTDVATGATATNAVSYRGPVPASLGDVTPALRRDLANSVNAFLTPRLSNFNGGFLRIQTTLLRAGRIVSERTQTFAFRPNIPLRVLLVPIMRPSFTSADLDRMKLFVNTSLSEATRRIMPTGDLEFYWSPTVVERNPPVNLSAFDQLYEIGHGMDQARRWWNERHEPDALIAYGIVDGQMVTGTADALAFWPNLSELINSVANGVDITCDVGNRLVQFFTLGLAGLPDGCQLEVPLYLAWQRGPYNGETIDSFKNRFGFVTPHEIGHVIGLVAFNQPNSTLIVGPDANISHSVTDELDNGFFGNSHGPYNFNTSFYRAFGVTEPVINPITQQQLLPQDNGDPGTTRAKAMMAYAYSQNDSNTFFEPVDIDSIFINYGLSSFRNFVQDLRPGHAPIMRGANLPETAASNRITPSVVSGPRLYVSGLVTRTNNTGELRQVELLGDNAPLSAPFVTGYDLVQLNDSGQELSRIGVYPLFSTETSHQGTSLTTHAHPTDQAATEHASGFFAATILRQPNVTRIELRHDNVTLVTVHTGASTPVVNLTSVLSGAYTNGDIAVSWSASDGDGDPLQIVIEYSADNGVTFGAVAFSSGNNGSVKVPVTQLAGSNSVRMRVRAGDGLNSGSATSEPFTVAAQPPRPYISDPAGGTSLHEGQRFTLFGGADDNQDGALAAEQLHWSSDRDGQLGIGSDVVVLLSVGTHILTLQAQNSVGQTAAVTTTVKVEGDYDADGLTDAQELALYPSIGLNPLIQRDAFVTDPHGLPLIVKLNRGLNPNLNVADSDGDGRSDSDEITTGTNPSAADTPLPADQLIVFPNSLTFTADLSSDTPLPQAAVAVVSHSPTTWTVTADVDWLGATVNSGTTTAKPTILLQAYLLENGVYHANLTFTSAALGNVVTVPVTATITNKAVYCDVNRDGATNATDIQAVSTRVGTNNTQLTFEYRYDLDRNGSIDAADVVLISQCVSVNPSAVQKIYLPLINR